MVGASIGVLALVIALIFLLHRRLLAYYANRPTRQHQRQLIMICVWLMGGALVVLTVPVGDGMRGQVLTFIGILLIATIGFSSTTLVGNAMAGLMLKTLGTCRIGSYVQVGEQFGRITNMNLLHIELQTEGRDLTTLPNLFFVSNPVTVLHESGTMLNVEIPISYDAPRQEVEAALLLAAGKAGLEKPRVQIRELGDHCISYRIAGQITDIGELIATRSQLRADVLDALLNAGIEMTSSRSLTGNTVIRPPQAIHQSPEKAQANADAAALEKAERDEELEALKRSYTDGSQRLLEIEQELKNAGQGKERRPLSLEKKKLQAALARMEKKMAAAEPRLSTVNK